MNDTSEYRDQIPLHRFLELGYGVPEAGTGRAVVTMPVRPECCGPTGNLHGGAIATMVDLSCALAAVTSGPVDFATQSLVTADMHVRYVGRPRTDEVVATASVVRRGGQLIVIECRVADSDDHLIAVADFSMMIVERRRPLHDGLADGETLVRDVPDL